MDQNTQDRRRSPPKVQMGLLALFHITCILSFVLPVSGSHCGNFITPKHMAFMEDLIGNQPQTSCNVTFTFVDLPNMHTDDQQKACYVLRAIPWVGKILKRQTESYTVSSTNFNHSNELKKLYDSLLSEHCLHRDEQSTGDRERCKRKYSMSPRDMLMTIKDVFVITKELLDKKPVECNDPYNTCEDLDDEEEPEAITTTGPAQCTCSCPSPGPTGSLVIPMKPGTPQQHGKDPTGMKEKIPALHLPSASKEGGIRVARTTQNIPGTPESLNAPDVLGSLRMPTVIMSAPTVEPEHVSILEAHRPWLLAEELHTGSTLASHRRSGSGSKEKLLEEHGPRGTEGSSSALGISQGHMFRAEPGDSTTFSESRARPRSAVTAEGITEQVSTEDWSLGSTEVPVSVSEEASPLQSSTEGRTIFSTEAPVSVSEEAPPHQPSTEKRASGRTEASYTTFTQEADPHQQSTDDNTIGSSEFPVFVSEETVLHQLSTQHMTIVSTEESMSASEEAAPQRPSTQDTTIDSVEVPTPVTKALIQQTSIEKKSVLPTAAIVPGMDEEDPYRINGPLNSIVSTEASVSVTEQTSPYPLPSNERTFGSTKAHKFVSENSAPRRPSFMDTTTGRANILVFVTDKQGVGVKDTSKTSTSSTCSSTVLLMPKSTNAAPGPEIVVGIQHAPLRPAAPGVFQGRGEGSQQSDERGESSAGPHHDSNLLPLYGPGPDKPPIPEEEESVRRDHLYLVVPCIVGILLALSGLLYYRHQNQILRHELQRTAVRTELQEERPLTTLQMVRLEMEE